MNQDVLRQAPAAVTVRAITHTDESQWRALWTGYQAFYEIALDERVTRATFDRIINPDEPLFAGVAVQDGQLAGLVNVVMHRSTWSVGNVCYLEDLYVAPAARSAGIGKMLIEWAYNFAQQNTCSRLYWHTHITNLRAQALYNKVAVNDGFIAYRMDL